MDIPGRSCLLCRVQGADCHYEEESNYEPSAASGAVAKGWSVGQNVETPVSGQKRKRTPDVPLNSSRSTTEFTSENDSSLRTSKSAGDGRGSESRRQGLEDPNNESVLIVGPMVAEDAQVIEKFMPPERSSKSMQPRSHPYNVYSSDPRKPILYTTVSRRRQGVRVGIPPGENQKEILEQILGPFKHNLVRL